MIAGAPRRFGSDERPTLLRGLFCGPLITGVTKEVNFRGGGLFCDLLLLPRWETSESDEYTESDEYKVPVLASDLAEF